MDLRCRGSIPRSTVLGIVGLLSLTASACAGAAPEDGITTNPDAKHDAKTDGGTSDDTEAPAEDTHVPAEDTAIADTGAPGVDSAVADTFDGGELTCALDEWDLDGVESNGCEFKDTVGNHTVATAFAFGDVDECDGSGKSHSGSIASDDRLHGSAKESGLVGRPQFLTVKHVAKTLCVNDPVYQITMSGGVGVYRVSIFRHGDTSTLDTKCSPHEIGGSETSADLACTGQTDGELVIIEIEKVSGPREKVSYTLKYHN